ARQRARRRRGARSPAAHGAAARHPARAGGPPLGGSARRRRTRPRGRCELSRRSRQPATEEPPVKDTEGMLQDPLAEQLEALRECREQLARQANGKEASPEVAGEDPREELQGAVEAQRLAERELRQQNEQLRAAQLGVEDERRRRTERFGVAPAGE